MRRKYAIGLMVLCAMVLTLALAACGSPQTASTESSGAGAAVPQEQDATAQGEDTAVEAVEAVDKTGLTNFEPQSLQDVFDAIEERNQQYKPEVRTLSDGTQVQLVPDVTSTYWHMADAATSYNTYYLNADNRGCVSCHTEGLADLVENKLMFLHVNVTNGLGSDVQPQDCEICHDQGTGYLWTQQQFGTLIHGIHSKVPTAGCMNCHTASDDTDGKFATDDDRGNMVLWEEAKYDIMQGFTWVDADSIEADFSYDQTTTTDLNTTEAWVSGETNQMAYDNVIKGTETDDATRDAWEFTVSGEVNNPFTTTLGELIAEAPSETFITSSACVMNPIGGEIIGNVEVTGIPISWLIEKAGGMTDKATGIMNTAPDGWARGLPLDMIEETPGYVVYQINGRNLKWEEGFPCVSWYPGRAIPSNIRWLSELNVSDAEEYKMFFGWELDETNSISEDELGKWVNKPNAGITHLHEGEIIPAGETHTFEGYAEGFDEAITAVEISLDNGATWKTYDVSDSKKGAWVYWRFNFTPDPGSYVISVRAVSETGKVTNGMDQCMFNAK